MYGSSEMQTSAQPDEPWKQDQNMEIDSVFDEHEKKMIEKVKDLKRRKVAHQGGAHLEQQDFIGFSKTGFGQDSGKIQSSNG